MVLKKKQAIKTHEALNLFNIGVTKSKQVTPAPPPKKKRIQLRKINQDFFSNFYLLNESP